MSAREPYQKPRVYVSQDKLHFFNIVSAMILFVILLINLYFLYFIFTTQSKVKFYEEFVADNRKSIDHITELLEQKDVIDASQSADIKNDH